MSSKKNTCVVWMFAYAPSLEVPRGGDELGDEERMRSDKFHFEADRERYRHFHRTKRRLLASAIGRGVRGESLQFGVGPQGKPWLVDYPELHFNLSHSREFGALAVSHLGPVGIDIECIDPAFPTLDVARNYFLDSEIAMLESAPQKSEQTERFFHLWTAKEAAMKLTGLGMTLEPRQIELAWDAVSHRPNGFKNVAGFPQANDTWALRTWMARGNLVVTVACEQQFASITIIEGETPLASAQEVF